MKKGILLFAIFFSSVSLFGQSHFFPNWSGGGLDVMTFTITQATINGVDMVAGDEIAVFDGSECVGVSLLSGVISGGSPLQILASRDDEGTPETDGYTVGNSYSFRVWDQSESREISGVGQTLISGDASFQSNGSASLTLAASFVVPNTAPVVSDIPDQSVDPCGTFITINLDDYVDDAETADENITWSNSGNSELGVSISNRVATITLPYSNWYGSESIVFTATDNDPTDPLSDSDGAGFSVSQMAVPVVGAITQPDCDVAAGSVELTGLPSGDWTLTIYPAGTETTGSGTATTVNNLSEGTYTFTITNSEGCTSDASTEVSINAQPPTPPAPLVGTITQPDCQVSTGSVELTGLPSGDWTLTIYPAGTETAGSGTATTVDNLTEGTYTFTVTNTDGCISGVSAEVIINAAPEQAATPVTGTITQPDCDVAAGSVELTGLPSGDWTLTTYPAGTETTGSGITTLVNDLSEGAYTFTITNSDGCTSHTSAEVTINAQPPTPPAPLVGTITQPDCQVSTGSVELTGLPSGDWTLTTYPAGTETTGSATTTTVNDLSEGAYTFTITNSEGCISGVSAEVTINAQPPTPTAPLVGTITQPDCQVSTGSVELTGLPSGDWTLTTYPAGTETTGSGATTTVNDLSEGNYTFTITNSEGCASDASSEVSINAQPPTPPAPLVGTITQPDCNVSTGTIQLTGLPAGDWILNRFPEGNTINGSGESFNISGLIPDAYSYTVTNSVGCESDVSESAVINLQPETPEAPVAGTITQPTCWERTGSVVLSGLPESGTWILEKSPGGDEISGTGTVTSVTGLDPGSYTFTVRNSSGCTSAASAEIVVNSQPDTPGNSVSLPAYLSGCQGESILLDPGPGFETYTWNTGQTTQAINVSSSGTYTVTVTEGDCSASASASVTINEIPWVDLGTDISSCEGESVILDAGEGFDSYYWTTGANSRTIEVSQDGEYGVTVSRNGCYNSDYVLVQFYSKPVIPLYSSYYSTGCISLDAGNPGSTYYWSTTETTQSIFACSSASYSVMVTNEHNCSSWAGTTVTIGDKPVVDLPGSLSACQGESLELDAGAGFSTYQWNTGQTTQTISVSNSGTYVVTVTDDYGEEASDNVQVTFRSLPSADLGSDRSVCQGESASLDAGAGFSSYLWSTGETTRDISVKTSGTFMVTVSDGFCSGSDEVDVQVNALPPVDLGPDITACLDEDVSLNAGGGFDAYNWNTGETSASIIVNKPGKYSVSVTENGCSASDDIEVAFISPPEVELGPDISSCMGETVILNAGAGFDNYEWSTGETTQSVSVSTSARYTITVSSGNCSASDDVNVVFNALPNLELNPSLSVCEGELAILDAGPGFVDYLWNTGATTQTISVSESGTYSVTVSDGICPAEDEVPVTFSKKPDLDLGPAMSACDGDVVSLDAGAGYDVYLWNTGESSQLIKVTSSGNYIVSVSNMCGATTDDIRVNFIELPEVELGSDVTISTTDELTLDAGAGYQDYLWNTGDTDHEIQLSDLSPGLYEYTVFVRDKTMCSNADTILVTVRLGNAVSLTSLDRKLNMYPNPAGDRFYVESDGSINSDIIISVYDGTGKLLLLEVWDKLSQNQAREVDVSDFRGGIYFVRFSSEEELAFRKLVIKR